MKLVTRNSLRWLPAFVVPAVVLAAVIAVPLQADASVDLPDKTPEEILLLLNDSTVAAFSGTVDQSSDLGLPSLDLGAGMTDSMTAGNDSAIPVAVTTALELLSGSHEFRVYVGGENQSRVQIKDRMAERDVVHNGSDIWLYDSSTNAATHLSLPADLEAAAQAKSAELQSQLPANLATPVQVAERLLSELDPSTTVSVGTDARIAGRSVYQLLLTPRTSDTLVASVSIAVDAETGLPLQVSVLAQGQSAPAFQVGFTAIDFAAPNADLFDFKPPANASVTEKTMPARPEGGTGHYPGDHSPGDHSRAAGELPIVTGTGWSTIVEVPAAVVPAELGDNPVLDQLTTAVDGGRALATSLVSVFLSNDGRVFVGAVPLAALQAVAQ